MIHGKKVGMIALANKLEDYTEADLQLVETFATLYATSVSSFFSREALLESNEKFIALYNDAPVAYFTLRVDGTIEEINKTGKALLEVGDKEYGNFNRFLDENGKQMLNDRITHGEEHEPLKLVITLDGSTYTVLLSMTPHFDERGYIRHFHCSALDISERKRAEEQLNFLAFHDEATQMPNRSMMQRHLEASIARAKRNNSKTALLFFDLDRFKNINDTLGHAVGDELLKAVADRLTSHFRDVDILSRFGGDEFVLIVDEVNDIGSLTAVSEKLIDLFVEPFKVGERSLYSTSSIGISIYPDDAGDADEMIKNADTAMYRGKERGGNNCTFYWQEFNVSAHDRLALEAQMRNALKTGEFELYYQPQYDIVSGKIVGVEALIRWNHPEKGMIPPLDFIPLAEDNGFIIPLGAWVIEEAMQQLCRWKHAGIEQLKMSINVSAKQFFHSDGLKELLASLLDCTAVEPSDVWIEITESTLANIEEMSRKLNDIQSLGISFAVDDFGTGYSSLNYLRQLPIDILKIDKSFVDEIGKNRDDEAISKAVISLAQAMGMKVIAEGVESGEHLEFLKANGCHYYQGYYGSRPLPAAEVEALLKD
jgi:diguanylate cyclase (GGDEF)-like protein/PAS domain S-box-containing protein